MFKIFVGISVVFTSCKHMSSFVSPRSYSVLQPQNGLRKFCNSLAEMWRLWSGELKLRSLSGISFPNLTVGSCCCTIMKDQSNAASPEVFPPLEQFTIPHKTVSFAVWLSQTLRVLMQGSWWEWLPVSVSVTPCIERKIFWGCGWVKNDNEKNNIDTLLTRIIIFTRETVLLANVLQSYKYK